MIPVHVVGVGMAPKDLTARARQVIREAEVLVGGKRLLDFFPDHPARKIPLGKDLQGTLGQIPDLAETRRVVVLASGDPNFYGVAPLLVKVLGAEQVIIHPNITAVQAACARLKMAWQDAAVVSLHGRSWEPLEETLRNYRKVILYTDPEHTPAAIARFLLERGYNRARLCVLEDLGAQQERVTWLTPPECEARGFSPLNLVVVLPEGAPAAEAPPVGKAAAASPPARGLASLHLGLPEEAFSHQAGLITKLEVRAVVLAKLALGPGQVLWDVGAGCGAVGLEASLLMPGGKIFAIEQDPERAAMIAANRGRFGVANLEVVVGRAPECLEGLPPPQRVFLGGGGRDLPAILQKVCNRLEPVGKVVLTAALLHTLETARAVLHQAGWDLEVTQIQVSRSRVLAGDSYLQALNPVWIVTGFKKLMGGGPGT